MRCTLKRTLLEISGLLLFACGTGQAQTTVRMEAEDMTLDTYKVEVLDFASNGALINLKGPGYVGNATAPFPGASGNYDITVVYHDENDGLAQLSVLIDGTTVDSWTLDFKSGESQPKPANRLTREIATGYAVSNGDEIRIDGLQGNWDHANVDYIEFTVGGPDTDINPPIVLDFSKGDVIIDEPGYYVLDRDSVIQGGNLFEVSANNVTIDLRGYSLDYPDYRSDIKIYADRVTLKNGTIIANSNVVDIFGDVLVTDMRLVLSTEFRIGNGCRLQNSVVVPPPGIGTTEIESGNCLIRANRIEGSIELQQGAHVIDNHVYGGIVAFGADDVIIARNTIGGALYMAEGGNQSQILDNLILTKTPGDQAITIDGTGHMLRGNIVSPSPDPSIGKWNYGIVFLQDGNYYGDNLISAEVPFELGGTTQVDLGGNQGL